MKKRYVVLAKDQSAIEAVDYDVASPDQILQLELSHSEYQFFFNSGLVDDLNSACNILIDDFEDEKIVGRSKLNAAINVLEKYRYSFPNKDFFGDLFSIFQKAIAKDTAVFFFF